MNKIIDNRDFTVSVPVDLYNEITSEMEKQNRSRNKQVIYWIRLGKLLDANPDIKTALLLKEQLQ
jgi:hypothetical protein